MPQIVFYRASNFDEAWRQPKSNSKFCSILCTCHTVHMPSLPATLKVSIQRTLWSRVKSSKCDWTSRWHMWQHTHSCLPLIKVPQRPIYALIFTLSPVDELLFEYKRFTVCSSNQKKMLKNFNCAAVGNEITQANILYTYYIYYIYQICL